MFLPLKDFLPKDGFPVVTAALMAINVLLYFVASSNPIAAGETAILWGVVPYEITHSGYQCVPGETSMVCLPADQVQAMYPFVSFPPTWLTIVSSMFLHGGLMHLIGNMLFLFVFGGALELALGRFSFLGFYFLGGVVAILAQMLWDMNSGVPMVGASGAIAAVLAGYLVLFPSSKILSLFIVFPVKVRAVWVIGLWLFIQLATAWAVAGSGVEGGVAVFAHLGGFAAGTALTYLLFDRETIEQFRHDARVANGLFVAAEPFEPEIVHHSQRYVAPPQRREVG